MAVLYLVALTGWLVVVGVVRSVVHQRSTGTAAIRFDDRPGAPQWWARLLGTLGLVAAVATPPADLAGLDPIAALDHAGVAAAGVLLVVTGTAGAAIGQAAMGSSWRADVDPEARTDLVADGPCRLVRNPILGSTAVAVVGLALIVPNAVAVGMVVSSLASWQLQVRLVEEPHLRAVHGTAYEAYARRTGRFLPKLRRRHPP